MVNNSIYIAVHRFRHGTAIHRIFSGIEFCLECFDCTESFKLEINKDLKKGSTNVELNTNV